MYKQFFPAECKEGPKGNMCRGKITEYQSLKSKIEINIPKVANKIVEYTNKDNTNKDNNKLLSLFEELKQLQKSQIINCTQIIQLYTGWPLYKGWPSEDSRPNNRIITFYRLTIEEDQKRIDELENQIDELEKPN